MLTALSDPPINYDRIAWIERCKRSVAIGHARRVIIEAEFFNVVRQKTKRGDSQSLFKRLEALNIRDIIDKTLNDRILGELELDELRNLVIEKLESQSDFKKPKRNAVRQFVKDMGWEKQVVDLHKAYD